MDASYGGEAVSWGSLYAAGITQSGGGILSLYHPQTDTPRQGSGRVQTVGQIGTTSTSHKVVTGSRGSNAALANLLTQLAELGIIVNSSTS